ncbi:protein kinase [Curtobacterium flaccumfaciens]|nr:protein kinase [Curtobacterium flaccumfaciens]
MAQDRQGQYGQGEPLGASYRLVELLGTGATGEVWRVEHTATGDAFAAKLLRAELAADPQIVERFVRERSVLLALQHPSVVRVRDLVVEGDRLAIVMDLVPGGSARDLLAANGPLTPRDALTITAETLDALAAAHEQDVTHRDVKPDNVLLQAPWESGATGDVRVSDFGIASVVAERERTTTGLLGTPQYMAPESDQPRPLGSGRRRLRRRGHALRAAVRSHAVRRAWHGLRSGVPARHVEPAPTRRAGPVVDGGVCPAGEGPERPAVGGRRGGDSPSARTVPRLGIRAGRFQRPGLVRRGRASGDRRPWGPPRRRDGIPDHRHRGRHSGRRAGPGARPRRVADRHPADGAAAAARRTGRRAQNRRVGSPAPEWLTNRALLFGGIGVVLVAALIVGGVVWLPGALQKTPGPGSATAQAANAYQQDQPLPTGLATTRRATIDPAKGTVDLRITYAAQAATLSGPFLEVLPGARSGASCPAATWSGEGITAKRNQPSLTGVDTACAWSLSGVEVPAGGDVTVEASVPLSVKDGAALQTWLEGCRRGDHHSRDRRRRPRDCLPRPAAAGRRGPHARPDGQPDGAAGDPGAGVAERCRRAQPRSTAVRAAGVRRRCSSTWPAVSPASGSPTAARARWPCRPTGSWSPHCPSPRRAPSGRRWGTSRTSRARPSESRRATERACMG